MLPGINNLKLSDCYKITDCAAGDIWLAERYWPCCSALIEGCQALCCSVNGWANTMGGLLLLHQKPANFLSPPALLTCGVLPWQEISLNLLSLVPSFSQGWQVSGHLCLPPDFSLYINCQLFILRYQYLEKLSDAFMALNKPWVQLFVVRLWIVCLWWCTLCFLGPFLLGGPWLAIASSFVTTAAITYN